MRESSAPVPIPPQGAAERSSHSGLDHTVAKRGFFAVVERWGLSNDEARQLLGGPSKATFYNYKKGEGGPLSRDTLDRVSYVLGIFKGLALLFPNPEQADRWMRQKNEAFGGRSALDHALAGGLVDLAELRHYLDQVRGQGGERFSSL